MANLKYNVATSDSLLYTWTPSLIGWASPIPSQSVFVAGCVYLLWSEGKDYQAVLQQVS